MHFRQKDLHFNWTCHQRPPVLTDHIFVANEVVFQDRFYCNKYQWITELNTTFKSGVTHSTATNENSMILRKKDPS